MRHPEPGLCASSHTESCSVCRDEGVSGTVVALHDQGRGASVHVDGSTTYVALDLVAGVVVGDRLLIHQGFAIAKLEPR